MSLTELGYPVAEIEHCLMAPTEEMRAHTFTSGREQIRFPDRLCSFRITDDRQSPVIPRKCIVY
jgi:hypothetical protein